MTGPIHRWIVISLVVGVLAACGSDPARTQPSTPTPKDTASSSEPVKKEPPTIDVVIADGTVRPKARRVDVKVGQKVVFNVSSDVAEELHAHSDPAQSFAIKRGRDQSFGLTIDTPGQVEVEAEVLGVSIVTLVVRP